MDSNGQKKFDIMESDSLESDEIYYSSDYNSDAEFAGVFLCGTDDASSSRRNYTVLTEAEIRLRQDEAITNVSSVLSLSRGDVSRLLCFYKWEIYHLHDAWFANEQDVRNKVGLFVVTPSANKTNPDFNGENNEIIQCGICFDDFTNQMIRSLACGHPFCVTCWKTYISTAIASGLDCLLMTCPNDCGMAVAKSFINQLASEREKEKYETFFMRSYVECKKEKLKWCPSPGCTNAIEFEYDSENNNNNNIYDVTCICSHEFCWKCSEEPHRPVKCKTVVNWLSKNSSEFENVKWVIAYSKPCPRCKRPIEKNRGCNHMQCPAPCKYEFCWVCLDDWSLHSVYYDCNFYKGPKLKLERETRKNAQRSLERYQHYYERWVINHESRQKAIGDLLKVRNEDLHILSTKVHKSLPELEFIVEAWKQIIDSRRVLKWSYAFAYYLLDKEPAKQDFFEHVQGEAEGVLEKLHAFAEIELSKFLDDNKNASENDEVKSKDVLEGLDFGDYRSKLIALTRVTSKFFEDLVRALENGLSEVTIGSTSKGRNKKAKWRNDLSKPEQRRRVHLSLLWRTNNAFTPREIAAANMPVLDNIPNNWTCDACSTMNPNSASTCQSCNGAKAS